MNGQCLATFPSIHPLYLELDFNRSDHLWKASVPKVEEETSLLHLLIHQSISLVVEEGKKR